VLLEAVASDQCSVFSVQCSVFRHRAGSARDLCVDFAIFTVKSF